MFPALYWFTHVLIYLKLHPGNLFFSSAFRRFNCIPGGPLHNISVKILSHPGDSYPKKVKVKGRTEEVLWVKDKTSSSIFNQIQLPLTLTFFGLHNIG